MSNVFKVKDLKKGWFVNHTKYGNLQYRGLVTKNPFTDEPKVPHLYLFWQGVDEDGNTQEDIVISNGNMILEVTDKIED